MNTQKVATYWNKRGETYDRSWQSVAKKRLSCMETDLVEDAIRKAQANLHKTTVKVLDIGIAIGRICDAILKHNVELYGTDISQTMIDYCTGKYKNNKKAVEFRLHDVHNPLPQSWGTFDVVSAFRVLAYTPHLEQQLRTIYNSMNKGGILVFTYPNKYSSVIISKIMSGKSRLGNEMTFGQLQSIIENAGFSQYRITGFSRLLDTFYDKSNSVFVSNILFSIEKIMNSILGLTLFTRLFYITCTK